MTSRRILVIALAVAVLFSLGWVWRSAAEEAPGYRRVPEGSTALVGDIAVRLLSLRLTTSVTGRFDDHLAPVAGAVLVLARVDYDATAHTGELYCQLRLVAGDASWDAEFAYSPPEPDASSCEAGSRGTVTVLFEVPESFVGRLEGVAVAVGADGGSTLLEGRPT
ncbi:MAG: hypothetical protein LCH96_03015 [Actinobacteria bacterium]|nr:hypothetical protein [Actinomycetota bacterium]